VEIGTTVQFVQHPNLEKVQFKAVIEAIEGLERECNALHSPYQGS